MTTLRREIKQKIKPILSAIFLHQPNSIERALNEIADAVLEIRAFKPNTANWSMDWAALGVDVSQDDIDREKMIERALSTFESDMGCPKSWNWYPARSSEEKVWKILRDFVVEKYQENPKAFQEYKTWSTQQFSRGAMTILAISKEPEKFPLSWTSFLDSNPNYGKDKKSNVKDDAHGIPKTY